MPALTNSREYAYDSTVVLRDPMTVANYLTNPSAQFNATGPTPVGLTSVTRMTSTVATTHNTSFRLNGSASFSNSYIEVLSGVVADFAGKTVTFSGFAILTAAQTGTADVNARNLAVVVTSTAAGTVTYRGTALPNAAGSSTVYVTVAIPADVTAISFRAYYGYASTGIIQWSDMRVVVGSYSGFYDGDSLSGYTIADAEYDWEGARGNSRTVTIPAGGTTLTEAAFNEISYDRIRTPYIQATLTFQYPGDTTFAALDPRNRPVVGFQLKQFTRDPAGLNDMSVLASYRPAGYPVSSIGKLWVRTRVRDFAANTVTVTLASGECLLEDKRRISATTVDTGATTVAELFTYAITDIGQISNLGFIDGYAAAAVPAGDRRLWLQGESESAIFENEATAVGVRAFADEMGKFTMNQFTQPPGWTIAGLSYSSGTGGTVVSAQENVSIEDDSWADAVLVKASYVDSSGTQQTAYQRDASGVNKHGIVVNISRPIPSANFAANQLAERQNRSRRISITQQIDYKLSPGRFCTYTFANGVTFSFRVDKVTFRPMDGVMEVEGIA